MLSPTQMKALNKFQVELLKFLTGTVRNQYVKSGRSISIYMRVAKHIVNHEMWETLDIGNITVSPQGRGLGMEVVNLIHRTNPFQVTYIESILNERFFHRLLKEGWKQTNESTDECPCVYRNKKEEREEEQLRVEKRNW